jgi:hypothetical protein
MSSKEMKSDIAKQFFFCKSFKEAKLSFERKRQKIFA